MLLIAMSWLYSIAISLIIGVGFKSVIKLQNTNTVVLIFFGFFGITLLTTFCSIFIRVNWEFHLILLSITIAIGYACIENVKEAFSLLKKEILGLSSFFKIMLFTSTILILAKCASSPYLIDNESYYIQTIKWLNEFGLVKGLVNLHPFLGQTSGWHILQSTFNYSFIYQNFNDLSGFCLLMGNFYAFQKLDAFLFKNEKSTINLVIGLTPLFNIYFFQFISAPSPDIAIYIISFIVFFKFIKHYKSTTNDAFIIISLLAIFATFVKLTAITICLFPLMLLIKSFSELKKQTVILSIIGVITVTLFIIKNTIVSGSPFYPLQISGFLDIDWKMPKSIETFYLSETKYAGYFTTEQEYQESSNILLFKKWLLLPKLHGFFNKLMVLMLLITPLVLRNKKFNSAYRLVYIATILSMLFLFFTSPQYRFFFAFFSFFVLMALSIVLNKKNIISISIMLGLSIAAIPLFIPIKLSQLTNNKFHLDLNHFSLKYIIKPHNNSRYSNTSEPLILGNTTINTPTKIDFFWGTGDVDLPALNKEQLDYFKTYYSIIPQQRTSFLKDGFYSKVLIDE